MCILGWVLAIILYILGIFVTYILEITLNGPSIKGFLESAIWPIDIITVIIAISKNSLKKKAEKK